MLVISCVSSILLETDGEFLKHEFQNPWAEAARASSGEHCRFSCHAIIQEQGVKRGGQKNHDWMADTLASLMTSMMEGGFLIKIGCVTLHR